MKHPLLDLQLEPAAAPQEQTRDHSSNQQQRRNQQEEIQRLSHKIKLACRDIGPRNESRPPLPFANINTNANSNSNTNSYTNANSNTRQEPGETQRPGRQRRAGADGVEMSVASLDYLERHNLL